MAQDYSIHFHVWDRYAMMEMILRARERFGLPLCPEALVATGDEVILVVCRGDGLVHSERAARQQSKAFSSG